MNIVDALLKYGYASDRVEARRMIAQGKVSITPPIPKSFIVNLPDYQYLKDGDLVSIDGSGFIFYKEGEPCTKSTDITQTDTAIPMATN